MISEEDSERFIEAQKCDNCLCWHKHCKAECCKLIFLNIDPKILEGGGKFYTMKLKEPLGLGERKYYQLHDVECIRGFLRFRKDRIIVVGRKVMYIHPCKLLKDNLCQGWPDNRPEICKLLTLKTAHLSEQGFRLTDNCLFKYKSREVKKDG